MTQTSAVIGTAQYLSPEQARGELVDARSDVYATGCVLYELLTGQPPFVGDNPVSVAYQHVREEPRPPSDNNRDVPPDVDAVVLKALVKNRMNRYQSAAEMRGDLLRAASGRPVLATPVLRGARAPVPVAPPPRVVGNRHTGTMQRVNVQRRRTSSWVLVVLSILGILAVVALGAGLYLAGRPQESAVPSLIGLTQPEAEQALNTAKLNGSPKVVADSSCPKDKVFQQDPRPGVQLVQGRTVSYNICGGPGSVAVPQLVGLDRQHAETQVRSAGLLPTVDYIDGLVSQKDHVASVEPAEGTTVPKGSTVKVHLSKGNQNAIPDLTGMTYEEARRTLSNLGFTNIRPPLTNINPPAGLAGKVTSQTPTKDTVIKLTDPISIVVGATAPSPPAPSASPSPSAT
jgi:serine/threonine-protein kinase